MILQHQSSIDNKNHIPHILGMSKTRTLKASAHLMLEGQTFHETHELASHKQLENKV